MFPAPALGQAFCCGFAAVVVAAFGLVFLRLAELTLKIASRG